MFDCFSSSHNARSQACLSTDVKHAFCALWHRSRMDNLSNRIKRIRDVLGLSQEALGDIAKISKQAVQQWESGQTKNIRNEQLFLLQAKTGFSAEWIATGRGNELIIDADNPMMERVRTIAPIISSMTKEEFEHVVANARFIASKETKS